MEAWFWRSDPKKEKKHSIGIWQKTMVEKQSMSARPRSERRYLKVGEDGVSDDEKLREPYN